MLGPGGDPIERAFLEPDALGSQDPAEPVGAGVPDGAGRAEVAGECHRDVTVEGIGEAGVEAWHEDVEMFTDLTSKFGSLADEVATVSGQELESDGEGVGDRLGESEAVDGGSVDGGEVGVVGFVAGIGGLSELLGGEGVDDPGVEAGVPEGLPDDLVVASGSFDGDNQVEDLVRVAGLSNAVDSHFERGLVVLDFGWRNEDISIKVSEHPFGASLGAVDGEDSEVLWSEFLDSGMDRAVGLVNLVGASSWTAGCFGRHDKQPRRTG